eukprot:754959-Hanusia_phi.AAC.1
MPDDDHLPGAGRPAAGRAVGVPTESALQGDSVNLQCNSFECQIMPVLTSQAFGPGLPQCHASTPALPPEYNRLTVAHACHVSSSSSFSI